MKLLKKHELRGFKEIDLLNIPIYQVSIEKNNNTKTTKYSIFPKSFEKKILDKIIKTINEKHDFVWIVRTAGLGEAYLLNFIIENLNKKYNAKNPCIVSNNKFYKELFEMYTDIPFYHIDTTWEEINISLLKRKYKYKGKTIIVYHCTYQESMNLFNNKFSKGKGEDYPTEIRKMSGATSYKLISPKYNSQIIAEVNTLCPNLNKDNFIFLVPEPKSVLPVSLSFWKNICSNLKEKGYDLFINTKTGYSEIAPLSAYLNIGQASYLASIAKGIIAIRCGFLEIISTNNIPKHVIYTPHKYNPVNATEMLRTSSLIHYPGVTKENLFEYNTDEMNETKIIEEIMKGF